MSASPIITGLTILFSISTVTVFLFPIVRLAPSWLERPLNKKIVFHTAAIDALQEALARAHNGSAQHARLTAELEYHRAALLTLAPAQVAEATKVPRAFDSAA